MKYPTIKIPESYSFNRVDIQKFLEKRYGMKLTYKDAEGSFICYLYTSKNKVIKVIKYNHDKAYQAFLELCTKTRRKNFPKIHKVEKFSITDGCRNRHHLLVITMERLYINDRRASAVSNYIAGFDLADGKEDWSLKNGYCGLKSKDQISRTIRFLVTKTKLLKKYCNDFHSGNIMFRKDGTPVIIDPVCVIY